MIIKLFLILIFSILVSNVSALENCKWNNSKGVPCTTITKTPNNSSSDVPSIVPPKEDKTTTRSRSSSVYDNGFILFTS